MSAVPRFTAIISSAAVNKPSRCCFTGHMVPADQPTAALRMLTLQMAGDVAPEAEAQHSTVGAALADAAEWLLPWRERHSSAAARPVRRGRQQW